MKKLSVLTMVFLVVFGTLALTGCNQNNNNGGENPPAVTQPEGETPEGEDNGPTIRPVDVEGEPETPVVEGETETPAEGEPETPVEGESDQSGSIVITSTLFKGLPATKALSADESGLTAEELNQAFLEIAAATDELELMLDGDGDNDYKKSCTVQADGSFFLRITSLLPGSYKLSLNTMSSTTGINGWGKSGVDVIIEASKVTQVTVALERMTTYAILGYFDAELAEDEDWSSFEAFLVDTAGNNYTAVLAIGDEGWTINGYNIPVSSIIEALKISGEDIETMMFAVDTTSTAFENGYSLFDVIDNEALLALVPDTGTIDITVPPIDLGEGEDEEGEGEIEGETEGESETEGEGEDEEGEGEDSHREPKILINGIVANEATVSLGQSVEVELRLGEDEVPVGHACSGELDGFVQTSPPVNHPHFAPPIWGRWETAGTKNLSISCYVPEVDRTIEVSFELEVINEVTTPTIVMEELIYSYSPRGNIGTIIAVPPGDDLRNYLTAPIGEIVYVGVSSTYFNNWSWNPESSPANPDTFWVDDVENLETLGIRTRFNGNIFRGNLFAVDVDGNMAFLNLSRWNVVYKNGLVENDEVVIDDGFGGLIIEFLD